MTETRSYGAIGEKAEIIIILRCEHSSINDHIATIPEFLKHVGMVTFRDGMPLVVGVTHRRNARRV